MRFGQIIKRIDNEIDPEEVPKAMSFIDRRFGDLWSKTTERLYAVLGSEDDALIQKECEVYETTILECIGLYKQHIRSQAVEALLFSGGTNETYKRDSLPEAVQQDLML